MLIICLLVLYAAHSLSKGLLLFRNGVTEYAFARFFNRTALSWGCWLIAFTLYYILYVPGNLDSIPKQYEFPINLYAMFSVFMLYCKQAFFYCEKLAEFKISLQKLSLLDLTDIKIEIEKDLDKYSDTNDKSPIQERLEKTFLNQKLEAVKI